MTLDIIGVGLGRTGTKSMQSALARLGFGPCHHMVEVISKPETVPMWVAAAKGAGNWDQLFQGYRSTVDWPSVKYWRELVAYYPRAKVLYTTRDPEAWFASTQATIFSPFNLERANAGGPFQEFFALLFGELRPHLADRDFMIDFFLRHDAEVRATIPKERLLVYEVGSGWAPLCGFLGVPTPDAPFPSENSRVDFARMSADALAAGALAAQPANSSHA